MPQPISLKTAWPSGKFNYNEDTGEYTYFDTEEEESRRITPVEFLIALGIALAAGGVAVSTVIGTYHLKWGTYEYPYKDKAGLKVRRSRDDFIVHVTHGGSSARAAAAIPA